MKVVTTVHKAGFEVYGHRWIESIKNWPAAEFLMYAEGFDPEGVAFKRTENVPRLDAFKSAHKRYAPPNWRMDIVRFSNKVFAAYDAFYDYDGIGVWLDADAVTYKPIPAGYIESQLQGAYLAHFRRAGHYTETGMWIMDCSHPKHREFLDTWIGWFESGGFTALPEWHDCTTLDATIKMTKVHTRSLSGAFELDMHPMAKAEISQYIDHCKGPRKEAGMSPENQHRANHVKQ